ncbi:hypothetical protein ScPMuIL_016734 [Solemya velum]
MSFNETFDPELNNPSSKTYKSSVLNYTRDFNETYWETPGFLNVTITGFRRGSVVVDYTVFLKADVNHTELEASLNAATTNIMRDGVGKHKISQHYLQTYEALLLAGLKKVTDSCEAMKGELCYPTFKVVNCTTDGGTLNVSCESVCHGMCGKHGECTTDSSDKPKCRCFADEKYTYSGDLCDIISEKLALESKYIIAIAAGCGGAVLLVLIIVTAMFLRKNKTSEEKSGYHRNFSMLPGDAGFEEGESDIIPLHEKIIYKPEVNYFNQLGIESRRPTEFSGNKGGVDNPSYGTPPNNHHGDVYRFYKDESDGSEAAIYQPRNIARPMDQTRVSPYQSIDTKQEYSIQRPKVNLQPFSIYNLSSQRGAVLFLPSLQSLKTYVGFDMTFNLCRSYHRG